MSFPNWKEVKRVLNIKSSSNFSYSCFQMFFPSVMCLQLTPNTASPTSAALQHSLSILCSLGRAPHLPIPQQGESSPSSSSLPVSTESLSTMAAPQPCISCLPVWSIIPSFMLLSSDLSVHPQVKDLLSSFVSASAKILLPHLAGWIAPLPNGP